MKSTKEKLTTYLIVTCIFLLSVFSFTKNIRRNNFLPLDGQVVGQPKLTQQGESWAIKSVDTEIVSRYHWSKTGKENVEKQIDMIADLGVNYIAIEVPYDFVDEMKIWTNAIHNKGLNVWFRSYWTNWEGDEGVAADMTPEEYLDQTYRFIVNNPELFKEGDAFTVAVEAEEVGVGLGRKFLNWTEYRNFLLSEISISSKAFDEIGLGGKIHTNWLSMNGWVVENVLTPELAKEIGLISVDHYVGQSQTIGELNSAKEIVNATLADLDQYYTKYKVPIFLGEWGYQIFQDTPEDYQANVIRSMLIGLRSRSYVVGMNYWVHMGDPAAIIDDENGTNLRYRKGAIVLKDFYSNN